MNFRCSRSPQKIYDAGTGSSADNRIIYHNNPLSRYRTFYYVKLNPHPVFPIALIRLDKCSADVFIFDETQAIGDPGLLRIAHSRIQSGIRNADDYVRVYMVA